MKRERIIFARWLIFFVVSSLASLFIGSVIWYLLSAFYVKRPIIYIVSFIFYIPVSYLFFRWSLLPLFVTPPAKPIDDDLTVDDSVLVDLHADTHRN